MRRCCNVVAMVEWATAEVRALGVLIAFFALLATLAYRWLVGHQRDFQMLLERIDREAEKREQAFDKEAQRREQAIQATLERIDREAEKREQAIQATLERIDREAEKREQAFDREAEKRQQAFDREAEKREQAIQLALERSDRAFETLTARANGLTKELAGIAQRTARSEGVLEALAAGEPRGGSKSTSAEDEPRTVAAQQVPGEPPAE